MTKHFGSKHAISISLVFQFLQLIWYGICTQYWMMWSAGFLAALSQMSYPAISAFVSIQTERELQGTMQGVLSAVRGLCQGVGPAIFGFVFYIFNMDLSIDDENTGHIGVGPQFPVPNIHLQPFDTKYRVIAPTHNLSNSGSLSINDTGTNVNLYLYTFFLLF